MLKLLPSKKKYCVFDIGTEKLVCLFFRIEDGKPFIIGMDHQKSVGFLNNRIVKEKLSTTISQTLKKSLPKNTKICVMQQIPTIQICKKPNIKKQVHGKKNMFRVCTMPEL